MERITKMAIIVQLKKTREDKMIYQLHATMDCRVRMEVQGQGIQSANALDAITNCTSLQATSNAENRPNKETSRSQRSVICTTSSDLASYRDYDQQTRPSSNHGRNGKAHLSK